MSPMLFARAISKGEPIKVFNNGDMIRDFTYIDGIAEFKTPYTPYYYGTDKATFEQDSLLQIGMNAVPVEVKAETNVRSQSLKAFYDKFHPEKSIRFSLLPYKDQDWMVNMPLYSVCNL